MEFKLTKDQQRNFNTVETGTDNYLIHGKPGVGKSVLINHLVNEGRKHYTLAAPTGLAALNIGGKTLHSLFQLPISQGIIDPTFNKFTVDDKVISNIRYNVKHLIIDEVSMVRADMFDYIERLFRHVKGNDRPFGGTQIILVGDFYQLPPVIDSIETTQLAKAGYNSPFIFDSFAFKSGFEVLTLDEVLRQKGDKKFINILHNARTADITSGDLKALNNRIGFPNDLRIKLTATNKQADLVNDSELNKLPGDAHTFKASVFGTWPAYPTDINLRLKVGAQVMVKMNGADRPPGNRGDFKSKVVNGTLGKVTQINSERHAVRTNPTDEGIEPNSIVETTDVDESVTIELENGDTAIIFGRRWERKVKVKQDDGTWDEKVVASFEQMPLTLAWAISIHKSQGQSFEKVHIDASRIFAAGQLYVALSRCRSLKGLSLQAPVDRNKFWANRDVIQFFNELEEQYAT